MSKPNFERLRVYQVAELFADVIWEIVSQWEPFTKATIGNQLVRAADSIGANIAEGCGRGSYQDNRRFIKIARGSLNETQHWLRRAFKRNLLTSQEIQELRKLVENLGPLLNGYLRSIGTSSVNSQESLINSQQSKSNIIDD